MFMTFSCILVNRAHKERKLLYEGWLRARDELRGLMKTSNVPSLDEEEPWGDVQDVPTTLV